MVRSVWVDHVFSSSSFSLPISARMSASSFRGSPLWAFTLISRVAAPAFTRLCSLMIIALRISPSGDRDRLNFAPPPIHLFIAWRVASLSVRYSRFSLSRWASRHSRSATSSGRFELLPSSSRPTLWECSSLCSLRWGGARC